MRRPTKLPSFTSVAAGETAVLDLPIDRRYHVIFLKIAEAATGSDAADVANDIRLIVDGQVQRVFTPAQINEVNGVNGIQYRNKTDGAGDTTIIPIYLSEPWRRTPQGEENLGWSMGDRASFTIEVDLKSGATAPVLSAWALTDTPLIDGRLAPLGPIVKWYRNSLGPGTTDYRLNTLPKRDAYQRFHFFTGTINKLTISADEFKLYERTEEQMTTELQAFGFVSADADTPPGAFHAIFDMDQRVGSYLPMVKGNGQRIAEFALDFELAATTAFTMLYQRLGTADR